MNAGAAPGSAGRRLGRLAVAAAAALALTAPAAQAGRPCEEAPLAVDAIERGMQLALNVHRKLELSGAQVIVIARAGQDLSSYGLRWSHIGLAYREGDGERSHWRIVHKLNHCGTPHGALYRQGLGPFFMDRPFRYEAAFVELTPEVQARLLPVLRDNAAAARLHESRYNMLAYPWATRYQQSNQWVIETLAGAMDGDARTRAQAQAWLQLRGYEPTTLHLNAFTRLGARVGSAHIAFDDHPNHRRYADLVDTVTVDSVLMWLERSKLAQPALHLR